LLAILTGNKEVLNEAGSLCNEEIPYKDAVYTREEMGLPPLPPPKKFKMRKWRQLEDGSWLPMPDEDDPPPATK
ncbi:hypothetical protein ACP3V9_24395, partial [Salmonella enterica]|uniref:hypothetical protein n=1 Tax=Salmonella enterica TaxID=28901 RepID=UPI003CF8C962